MAQYHEPVEELTALDRSIVQALESLKEEIEAVNWYHQRAAVATYPLLKDILIHNRDEEIEHACMCLEFLRRSMKAWDEHLNQYLFKTEPIVEIEELEKKGEGTLGIGAIGD